VDQQPRKEIELIVVVKKTFRYSNVFFYNHLCRVSAIRNIIMKSGIKRLCAGYFAIQNSKTNVLKIIMILPKIFQLELNYE
jgi:hypothetical protein